MVEGSKSYIIGDLYFLFPWGETYRKLVSIRYWAIAKIKKISPCVFRVLTSPFLLYIDT